MLPAYVLFDVANASSWEMRRRGGRYVGAQAPDSGGAQAGGVSPPFTACVHSWFEVFGARRGGEGVGRGWEGASGVGREEREG